MALNQRLAKYPSKTSLTQKLLGWIQAVTLATWFGSMVFVSFIGAPTAFQVVNDTRTAGAIVGGMLNKVYLMSYGVGVIVFCLWIIQFALGHLSGLRLAGLVLVLFIGLGMNVYAREVVARRMAEIRRNIDQVNNTADQQQLRATFDRLHRYSVWLMGGSMIAGLILISAIGVGTEPRKETNRWRM
ncbi:MAG: DUF4149 domain-containing protein [Blastocatellia bacterium]|nr:DUF4149 domain-containing protein [Blastocatellia bacterium]